MKVKLQYTPYPKQREVHNACDNPMFRYITVLGGR